MLQFEIDCRKETKYWNMGTTLDSNIAVDVKYVIEQIPGTNSDKYQYYNQKLQHVQYVQYGHFYCLLVVC